ncbi:MAG: Flp pilus assembly complex ATPase component TadA [Eubacterium sp.]|nr:Flp pilus assembly complex ATPase component TadA [Eubacterium sp.]
MDRGTPFTLEEMAEEIKKRMNSLLRSNLYDMNLSQREREKFAGHKKLLREHIRLSGMGNGASKEALREFIKEGIIKTYGKDESLLDRCDYFSPVNKKRARYKFEILLYVYTKRYEKDAADMLFKEEEAAESAAKDNTISQECIEKIYERINPSLEYRDKLEVIALRIYENIWGLGSIDALRDMKIDGISGGVSGDGCVWVFYRGVSVALPFMEIKKDELERICRVLSRCCEMGQLSEAKGYLVGDMKDHARVVVARPPFAEMWTFFIRKFDTAKAKTLEELLSGEGAKIPQKMLKFFMKGAVTLAVTGIQGSGKTTLLSAMIGEIPKEYTLRVLEMAFELHLRDVYPKRNIVTLRETAEIAGREGLDLLKKTDGNVSIIGEVASAPVAALMIESGQVGTLFTLFTHHAKTAEALISSLRNCLLKEGSFSVEEIAEQQVVSVVRVDVHLHKDRNGHRYIERISEIVPERCGSRFFRENVLMSYEDGRYVYKNPISNELRSDMKKWMTGEERREFDESMALWALEKTGTDE